MDTNARLALVEKIEAAFADVPYPAYLGSELAHLEGKHWRDVTAADFKPDGDDWPMLSAEGFRFFMPAILKSIILDSEALGDGGYLILHHLAPPKAYDSWFRVYEPPEFAAYLKEQFAMRSQAFSPREREAICAFLEAYMDLEPDIDWDSDDGFYLLPAIDFWCRDK